MAKHSKNPCKYTIEEPQTKHKKPRRALKDAPWIINSPGLERILEAEASVHAPAARLGLPLADGQASQPDAHLWENESSIEREQARESKDQRRRKNATKKNFT